MKIRRFFAVAAAAVCAVSMMAFSAFAETIELDSSYPGAWSAGKCISKADLEAIGGDVKVVLTVEVKEPLIGDHNQLFRPMDYDAGWKEVTSKLQSEAAITKSDGMIVVADGQTTVEFIIPASVIAELGDSGLGFQVNDVFIKSAELTLAESPEPALRVLTVEEQAGEIMNGKTYEEATGASSPAADGDSASAGTGNTSSAVILSVMAIAGAASVVSRKRK